MKKQQIRSMAQACRQLHELGFNTVAEALVFFATAEATNGTAPNVTAIRDRTGLPMSTVSRVAWGLRDRGLFDYEPDPKDRRQTVVRANVGALGG